MTERTRPRLRARERPWAQEGRGSAFGGGHLAVGLWGAAVWRRAWQAPDEPARVERLPAPRLHRERLLAVPDLRVVRVPVALHLPALAQRHKELPVPLLNRVHALPHAHGRPAGGFELSVHLRAGWAT